MKHTLILALSLGFAVCVAPAGPRASAQKSEAAQKPAAPKQAAEFKVVETEGAGLKALREASAASGRPLLVNFWATWCVPCREEFPDLVKIRERYAADRLDFVTVSLDDVSELTASVPEFLREMRATHIPAYLLNAPDPEAVITLFDPTWRGELPATFLYDRAGKLAFVHRGRVKPAPLREAIEKTLK